ncbi:hypothetical protein FAM09_24645 [Niastella caeni]|uniref:Uncharacterized protein n=1 Tax=Niastella caeni TaxID=2569763 RepID=A0A4S8HI58_9BACT|nr:hypothetical protein [Niastella caeni]THU34211.1 hypothetical protein FAM09_24645 [Niastella caeni]
MGNVTVGTGPQSFGNEFEEAFKSNKKFSRDLYITLYSLGSFRGYRGEKYTDEELAEAIKESFIAQKGDILKDEEKDRLYGNLVFLLKSVLKLQMTFKAFSLASERESVYRDARIVTDIRPLFNENLSDKGRYGLVTHQLKLTTEENDESVDYFFGLSLSDLKKLKEQIERAIDKENLIRDNYKDQISFITITE